MKKTETLLVDQVNLWKLGDSIDDLMRDFNKKIELTGDDEKEFERLRKEVEEILKQSEL